MNDTSGPQGQPPQEQAAANRERQLRLRFPFFCVLIFWVVSAVMGAVDTFYFMVFFYRMISATLVTLLFLGWWSFNRGLRVSEKLAGLAVILAGGWVAARYSHHTIGFWTVWMFGGPVVVTVVVGWLWAAKRFHLAPARLGFSVVVALTWGSFLLTRADGLDSRLRARMLWRWTPTAEELFLANSGAAPAKGAAQGEAMAATVVPGDWTSFRGTNRDGVIRGTTIATNWTANPPAQIWKREVGPAWSSLLVVGNRLFTQEQRGTNEAVVCYDANNGSELWIAEDAARFEESVSGAGPRATPTFANGKLYVLGGTGFLSCLEPATGRRLWKRDIKEASGAKVPMWAFSSSPLVTDGLVLVYAGGEAGKGLLAYHADSGDLAWSAPAGVTSYSSPQLAVIAGVPQCLMYHDGGLTAVDLKNGRELWKAGLAIQSAPRCGQPHLVGGTQLLVSALDGIGCSLIQVSKSADKWSAANQWKTKDLKPEFPDFVIHRGYVYGFDVSVFCCINLADGKRCWKEGRYGRGQVMLLADQEALLVTSETGELVLLAADPKEHRELGRFQALAGKTWNHPVVRLDRVYLRNAQEMACYAIGEKSPRLASVRE